MTSSIDKALRRRGAGGGGGGGGAAPARFPANAAAARRLPSSRPLSRSKSKSPAFKKSPAVSLALDLSGRGCHHGTKCCWRSTC